MGYTVPVGRNCGGAFAGSNTKAAGEDIANAMNGKLTHVADACAAAAPAQMGVYWAIIGFGAAIVILGIVLNSVAQRPPVVVGQQPVASASAELMRLATLRDQGAITADEFQMLKRRVIGAP
ncbi:SHOCT domain-containing protein [Arthrobacter sp. STN4]|uniref:SHOCT domain-containing protein n=1 Tax=Arthrobacter sp. STN4 TaxID=2923276 RepID=UPI00211A6CE2|nr:SHOCT domain-containing protein [Arthrobacter sp. STN4]MCQ9162959.1 SHOCT domain-containing protein [Arthrobacter sp. STN4]